MINKKRVHTDRLQVVSEDGELLSESIKHVDIPVKTRKEFFYTFSAHFQRILNLDGNEMKVLLWCSMNCGLNTNEIALPKGIKERMMAYIGIKRSSVDNALSKLVKKGMMKRLSQGLYLIDPEMTWRGDIKNGAKHTSVMLNYSIEDTSDDTL